MADSLKQIARGRGSLAGIAFALVIAAGVFWVGFDKGGYGLTSRGTIAVVLLWALALALSASLWPVARVPRAALLAGTFLAGFAVWTGLSAFWAASAEAAFNEFDRALLYLGAFALALVAAGPRQIRPWLAGLAVGLTAIGLLALVSRLFPNAIAAPGELAQLFPAAERRLSYPVDYWNGLATLIAFALPLLLFFAIHARTLLLRALALGPFPALVATIYLTSSRGGAISAALALAVFIGMTSRRWAAIGALLVAAAGSAGAVAVFLQRPELVNHPHEAPQAVSQGHTGAVIIGLISIATALVYALAARFAPRPRPIGRIGSALVAGALVAVVAIGLIAAHPIRRFESFKAVPRAGFGGASVQEHLFAATGNGRWQLWQSAVDEFETRPVTGRGAGSYEAWWSQHGSLPYFVRDAHSLYVETLGELGIVGLLLLLAFFGCVLVSGVRRLAGRADDERSAIAVLLAVFVAFLFEAAVDWMWELTVVTLVAVVAAGFLTGSATAPEATVATTGEPRRRRSLLALRGAAVAVIMAIVVLEAVPLFSTLKIRQSQDAARAGDLKQALTDAQNAESLEPWAASPHLQRALVFEAGGDLPGAIDAIHEAIGNDESDWRLWLVAARLETKAGKIAAARSSLDRARTLNPRSPLFARS